MHYLDVVETHYPEYMAALTGADTGDYELVSGDGAPRCRKGNAWVHGPDDPWEAALRAAAECVADEDALYVIVRPGFGYLALALFHHLGERARTSRFLLVEDRIPLVRLALRSLDLTPLFVSKASRILLGPLPETLHAFLRTRPEMTLLPIRIACEHNLVAEDEPLVAWLAESIGRASLTYRRESEEALESARTARRARSDRGIRKVFLAGNDHPAFTPALADGLREAGCDVEVDDRSPRTAHFVRHHGWIPTVTDSRPDVILWRNGNGLSEAGARETREQGIHNVVWGLDNPRWLGPRSPVLTTCDLYLSFDATYLADATAQGARRVAQLSTAAGVSAPEGCRPGQRWPDRQGPAISFVGTLGQHRIRDLRASLARYQPGTLSLLDEVARTGGDVLEAMSSIADGEAYAGAPHNYVEEVRSSERRKTFLLGVAGLGLRIYGAEDWGDPRHTGELAACYAAASLDYGPALAKHYYHAQVNINVFHVQCVDSTNPRVYDVLAAGGFLLTEDRPRIAEEFEIGRHLETFRTPEEAAEKAAYFLAHPAERDDIARAGQAHVLANHTYASRAKVVLRLLAGHSD